MDCDVEGCRLEAQLPHRLRETSGFEYPEEVGVCLEHKAQLEAGVEYSWNPGWRNPENGRSERRLVVGERLLNKDEYILKEVKSARVEFMSSTSNPDESGPIFTFSVRRPGGPIEEMELVVPRSVLSDLHHYVGNFIPKDSDANPFGEDEDTDSSS